MLFFVWKTIYPQTFMVFHGFSLLLESQDHSLSSPLHGFSLHLHFRLPFVLLSTSVLQPPLPPLWSWNILSTLPPQSLYACYFLSLEYFSSHILYGCSWSSRPFLSTEDKTQHLFPLPQPLTSNPLLTLYFTTILLTLFHLISFVTFMIWNLF